MVLTDTHLAGQHPVVGQVIAQVQGLVNQFVLDPVEKLLMVCHTVLWCPLKLAVGGQGPSGSCGDPSE